jgi:hypothetical protein
VTQHWQCTLCGCQNESQSRQFKPIFPAHATTDKMPGMSDERKGFLSSRRSAIIVGCILQSGALVIMLFFDGQYIQVAGMFALGIGIVVQTIPDWRER